MFGNLMLGVGSISNGVQFSNSWQNAPYFVLFQDGQELLASLDRLHKKKIYYFYI